MKKNNYNKPNICVVKIQQRQNLLQESPGSPPSPGGGNVREYSGDSDEGSSSSGGSVWDEEW